MSIRLLIKSFIIILVMFVLFVSHSQARLMNAAQAKVIEKADVAQNVLAEKDASDQEVMLTVPWDELVLDEAVKAQVLAKAMPIKMTDEKGEVGEMLAIPAELLPIHAQKQMEYEAKPMVMAHPYFEYEQMKKQSVAPVSATQVKAALENDFGAVAVKKAAVKEVAKLTNEYLVKDVPVKIYAQEAYTKEVKASIAVPAMKELSLYIQPKAKAQAEAPLVAQVSPSEMGLFERTEYKKVETKPMASVMAAGVGALIDRTTAIKAYPRVYFVPVTAGVRDAMAVSAGLDMIPAVSGGSIRISTSPATAAAFAGRFGSFMDVLRVRAVTATPMAIVYPTASATPFTRGTMASLSPVEATSTRTITAATVSSLSTRTLLAAVRTLDTAALDDGSGADDTANTSTGDALDCDDLDSGYVWDQDNDGENDIVPYDTDDDGVCDAVDIDGDGELDYEFDATSGTLGDAIDDSADDGADDGDGDAGDGGADPDDTVDEAVGGLGGCEYGVADNGDCADDGDSMCSLNLNARKPSSGLGLWLVAGLSLALWTRFRLAQVKARKTPKAW